MGDEDRDAILGRRKKLIALALAGLTTGCASPMPCLSPPPPDVGIDAGIDAGVDAEDAARDAIDSDLPDTFNDPGMDAATDAEPEPCLAPPLPDAD